VPVLREAGGFRGFKGSPQFLPYLAGLHVARGGIATPSDCQVRGGASHTCSESRSMCAGGFSSSSSSSSRETGTERRKKSGEVNGWGEKDYRGN